MSKSNWLRRALLGGVALSVMTTGAQADELSALKAQLEALQSRVNQLESAPAPAALPEGYSYLTYARGQGSNNDWGFESKVDQVNQTENRGFTLAVTPTADIPAPVAEVTVYGYVKGDVIYAFNGNQFINSTAWSSINSAGFGGLDDGDHISIHAKQSRFGIKSKVDTAIGQIRTRIEGDFEGAACYGWAGACGAASQEVFRLRHAYGEWDMTENLTLIVGQTWRVAALLPLGISTVDFAGSAGWTYSRDPQVKIRYTSGPITVRLGIEEPVSRTESAFPVFGGSILYDVPGGHQVMISGAIGETDLGADDDTTYVLQGGFNINVADVATLTAAAVWGEGSLLGRYMLVGSALNLNTGGDGNEVLGLMAGVSVPVTDTTTFNVVWDYMNGDSNAAAGNHDELHTIHANIMWQPVKQMRMGWEALYLWAGDEDPASTLRDDHFQLQWGTWFFF